LQCRFTAVARRGGALAALALLLAGAAAAEETEAAPAVELDRLYRLPDSVDTGGERLGSATRTEWRARFASALAERAAAQAALEEAQKELGEAADGADPWQIAPPGVQTTGASEAPVSYQLRQEVRRQREEVDRSERRLRELTIQADLAGVPADWRE
jgi:hypothetical protein